MSTSERGSERRAVELTPAVTYSVTPTLPEQRGDSPDTLLFEIANAMLRHRAILMRLPLLVAAIVVAVTLILPRTYTTRVSFAPAASGLDVSKLSGIAAQFGLSLPTDDPTQSPLFYADLIQTPQFLQEVVTSKYAYPEKGHTVRGTLTEIYEIDEGDRGKTIDAGIKLVADEILSVTTNRQTNVVGLTIRTISPQLSLEIGQRVVELLNDFNIKNRQTQAEAQREFVRQRTDSAQRELRASENALQAFLQRNRIFQLDPGLSLEHDRLQRDVSLRQQVYTTLVQAYEQARIEAVRNTPSITLVEVPAPALRADRRKVVLKAALALFSGVVLAGLIVFVREYIANGTRSGAPPVREFGELSRETLAEVKRFPRRVLRWRGRHRN